jgi:uncharacterized membrane protein
MTAALIYLQQTWLAWACLVAAAPLLLGALWRRQRSGTWPASWIAGGASLLLFGVGSFGLVSSQVGLSIVLSALAVLIVLLTVTVASGRWWAPLGYALAAVMVLGIGIWLGPATAEALLDAARFFAAIEPLEPAWLLLLLLLLPLVWFSRRNLASLGPVRGRLALGLRCLLLLCLALALAEAHSRRADHSVTVLFLWDRSLSVPPEFKGDVDERTERIRSFINDAVAQRGPGHETDQAGVIVFGRRPRLELPPASVPKLGFHKIQSQLDDTYTDIAAALKLALASFPEATGKRIVLISDGNENLGQAEEQARIARQNGVQIDVLPIAAERRNTSEVLVERVEAPPQTEQEARVPLRVVIRSYHPHVVVGTLQLDRISLRLKQGNNPSAEQPTFEREPVVSRQVELRQGLNPYYFQQPAPKQDDAFTYEARFVPSYVKTVDGRKLHDGLPGDRIENNRASVSVMARGQRTVLLIEPKVGDHPLLAARLRAARSGLRVVSVAPERLPENATELALVLSRFDAAILANIPADSLSEEQQKVMRSMTHDQGMGLIMVGGNQAFGAGGWQGTELEKALPVTADIKSMKVEGKSGLVMMMHASEMAEGNAWQRKIAKLAVEKLSPMDMVGQIHYSHGGPGGTGHVWHIKFQQIGGNRNEILHRVDTMQPGDMPDVDPAFAMAYKELTTPGYNLGTKHIIFISDGDHWSASPAMLNKIRTAKITCTTVCITTHGLAEVQKMKAVADFTRGRSYHIKNPSELPAIYIRESRLVSQSFVQESKIQPEVRIAHGPTEGIAKVEPLYGFVRTTRRPSPLVEVPIESPRIGGFTFPILAEWQYGLGRAVAFTSDARTDPAGKASWDKDWANSDTYTKFWEQTVDWALRPTETGKYLRLSTEQRDGKIRLIVEGRDLDKTPLTAVEEFKAGITIPSLKGPEGRKLDLKFEQKGGGIYEADIPADEVGTYFINIRARWKKNGQTLTDSVRAGVTVPYSPEFAEMESNPALLEKLREITAGHSYAEDDGALRRAARSGEVFRAVPANQPSLQPLWPWFVLLTALCLVLDIAVRRVALEPRVGWAKALTLWQRLRREPIVAAPEFLARLQSRKAQVDESLARQQGARKFEGGDVATGPLPTATEGIPAPSSSPPAAQPPPPVVPAKEEDAGDYASRLLRAKKRALEEREKKNKPS